MKSRAEDISGNVALIELFIDAEHRTFLNVDICALSFFASGVIPEDLVSFTHAKLEGFSVCLSQPRPLFDFISRNFGYISCCDGGVIWP